MPSKKSSTGISGDFVRLAVSLILSVAAAGFLVWCEDKYYFIEKGIAALTVTGVDQASPQPIPEASPESDADQAAEDTAEEEIKEPSE